MLEADNVSYTVSGKSILRDVSVSIHPGRVTAIAGPNGAGKSTLLRLLCGELAPSLGSVRVDGEPLSAIQSSAIARRRAVVSQEQSFGFNMPAFDVAMLGRTPHVRGSESTRDYEIVAASMDAVHAIDLADADFPVLSGGEKQKVALARGGAQIWEEQPEGPRYLLLDEPTNNLDLSHQHTALQQARAWAESGVGVLVVLHDLNLAAQYADKLVVLRCGTRVADGHPGVVLTGELMRDVFNAEALVQPHPCLNCPLVVTLGPAGNARSTASGSANHLPTQQSPSTNGKSGAMRRNSTGDSP